MDRSLRNNETQTEDVCDFVFTPPILELIDKVGNELNSPEDAKVIQKTFDAILKTSRRRNNGTMLLALVGALNVLLITATEQAAGNESIN